MRLIWSLLLVIGCGDKDGSDTGDEADADADTDTDADSDADADADAGLCGVWSGVVSQGSTWEYDYVGQLTGDATIEVTSVSGSAVEFTSVSHSEAQGSITDSTSVLSYTCDSEGMWLEEIYTDYSGSAAGYKYSGWTETVYDAPILVTPSSLSVGDSWTVDASGVVTTSDGASQPFSTTTTYEAVAEESVTVPAGTYTAIKLVSSIDGSAAASWTAEGVGTVKTDSSELTGYTP